MVSPLMTLVARTVAASPLAEDCTVTTVSGGYPTRATWVRRESEGADGEVILDSAIRVPAGDVADTPSRGDQVVLDGRTLYATYAHLRGPVLEIGLTARRNR